MWERNGVQISDQGEAMADVVSHYSGLQQERYEEPLYYLNQPDQQSWVFKQVQLPTFELKNFALNQQKSRIPVVSEKLSVLVRRWATPSGTRLFLPLNLLSVLPPATPATAVRQSALDLDATYDFEDSDTVTYQLPVDYMPEFRLEPLTIASRFGQYTAQVLVDGHKVTYIRQVTMHRGRYPAAVYVEWVDFRKKIAKADRAQMVFVKKQ